MHWYAHNRRTSPDRRRYWGVLVNGERHFIRAQLPQQAVGGVLDRLLSERKSILWDKETYYHTRDSLLAWTKRFLEATRRNPNLLLDLTPKNVRPVEKPTPPDKPQQDTLNLFGARRDTGQNQICIEMLCGQDGTWNPCDKAEAMHAKGIEIAGQFGGHGYSEESCQKGDVYRDGYLYIPSENLMSALDALDSAGVHYDNIDLPAGLQGGKLHTALSKRFPNPSSAQIHVACLSKPADAFAVDKIEASRDPALFGVRWKQAAASQTGLRKPGDLAWFEYRCWESPHSDDAPLWYHSHQRAKIVRILTPGRGKDANERALSGTIAMYRIRFADGYEDEATEDELLDSRSEFTRPDPPKQRRTQSANENQPSLIRRAAGRLSGGTHYYLWQNQSDKPHPFTGFIDLAGRIWAVDAHTHSIAAEEIAGHLGLNVESLHAEHGEDVGEVSDRVWSCLQDHGIIRFSQEGGTIFIGDGASRKQIAVLRDIAIENRLRLADDRRVLHEPDAKTALLNWRTASRITLPKLRRLFDDAAQGMVDGELLDDVYSEWHGFLTYQIAMYREIASSAVGDDVEMVPFWSDCADRLEAAFSVLDSNYTKPAKMKLMVLHQSIQSWHVHSSELENLLIDKLGMKVKVKEITDFLDWLSARRSFDEKSPPGKAPRLTAGRKPDMRPTASLAPDTRRHLLEIELDCANEEHYGKQKAEKMLARYQSLQRQFPDNVAMRDAEGHEGGTPLYKEASVFVPEKDLRLWLDRLRQMDIAVDVIHFPDGSERTAADTTRARASTIIAPLRLAAAAPRARYIRVGTLYHLAGDGPGLLRSGWDPGRMQDSLYGRGFAVSTVPDAWRTIAKLGGRDLIEIQLPPGAKVLDLRATFGSLEAEDIPSVWRWAVDTKRAAVQTGYRVWSTDEEGGQRYSTFRTRKEAEDELDEGGRIEAVQVLSHAFGEDQNILRDFVATHYPQAAVAWYADRLDAGALSAPQGYIVPGWENRVILRAASQDASKGMRGHAEATKHAIWRQASKVRRFWVTPAGAMMPVRDHDPHMWRVLGRNPSRTFGTDWDEAREEMYRLGYVWAGLYASDFAEAGAPSSIEIVHPVRELSVAQRRNLLDFAREWKASLFDTTSGRTLWSPDQK